LWCENRNHGAGINKRLAYFNTVSGLPVQIPPTHTMVSVNQVDESNNPFDKIKRWNQNAFTKYKVPYEFVFEVSANEVLLAKQDFKSGTTQKYNEWENINNNLNHETFTIAPNQEPLIAIFKIAYNATIHTEFITISQMDTGEVQFKDPWLRIDGDPKYNDPPYGYRNLGMDGAELEAYQELPLELFTSDPDFKGVFLDQLIQDGVYYSVAAPEQQLNGVTYFLSDWSAENNSAEFEDASAGTTAVIFRSPNAIVTANMKGHLASSTANATAFNNGRRVVVDNQGTWHLVYEDGGNIYYSNSTDNGQTWSRETRLSSTASRGKNRSPSIAYRTGIPQLGVVWDREENGLHFPVFRYRVGSSPWSPEIFAQSSDQVTSPENCKPVLIHAALGGHHYNSGYTILCRVNSAGKKGIGVLLGGNLVEEGGEDNDPLVWMGLVDQTTQYSDHPTVTAPHPTSPIIHISWEDNHRIFYSSYDGEYFTPAEEISQPIWEGANTNQNPSNTFDAIGKVDIVWQHNDGFPTFQHIRGEPGGGNWEPIREVGCGSCHGASLPSIGAYSGSASGELVSTIRVGSYVNFLDFDGEEWDLSDDYFPGTNPCLNGYGTELNAVWTFHNEGLPYLIKNQVFSPQLELTKGLNWVEKNYRKEMFYLSELPGLNLEGKVELSFGDILIQQTSGTQNWRFGRLKDTLNFKNFLQTTSLTITNNMQSLIIPYQVRIKDFKLSVNPPALPLLRLRLMNSITGNQLAMLKNIDLNTLIGPNFQLQDTLIVELTQFRNKEVVLQMQTITHLVSSNQKPIQVDIKEFHHASLPENLVLKNTSQTELQVLLPDKFNVSQNYPNPFNPATTVEFQLPRNSFVNLKIYDIQGRLVKTLLKEELEAGIHQAVWDGRDELGNAAASGVYLYHLQAGNFVQTRKMLLVR
jgi:hypothetical protein